MDYVFPIHNRLKSRVGEVGVAVAWCTVFVNRTKVKVPWTEVPIEVQRRSPCSNDTKRV